MGKDKDKKDYFKSFKKMADFGNDSVKFLTELLENYDGEEQKLLNAVESIHEIETSADKLNRKIQIQLISDFVTPIERADIADLMNRYDDVCDSVERTVRHLYMYDVTHIECDTKEMIGYLNQAAESIVEASVVFKGFKKNKDLTEHLRVANECEGFMDDLYMRAVRNLYVSGDNSPEDIYKWQAIYGNLESTADAIERLAVGMQNIVIRNS